VSVKNRHHNNKLAQRIPAPAETVFQSDAPAKHDLLPLLCCRMGIFDAFRAKIRHAMHAGRFMHPRPCC
jgi:hypothetical protein